MGAYTYIKNTFEKEYKERSPEYRERIAKWAKEPTIVRIEKPTNITRARELGYKAKNGFVVVRVKIRKGRRKRPKPSKGRKPGHNYRYVQPLLSLQAIAEQRVGKQYKNLEVINSYWVGENGTHKFYEVILGDPVILKEEKVLKRKGRVFRGLTSAGKKVRGLRKKKSREGSKRKAYK